MIPLPPEHAALLQRFREKGIDPRPGEIAATLMFRDATNSILAAFPAMAVAALQGVIGNYEQHGMLTGSDDNVKTLSDTAVASLLLSIVREMFGPEARQQFANSLAAPDEADAEDCWATVHADIKILGIADKENLALRVKFINALRDVVGRRSPKNAMGSALVSDADLLCAERHEWREAYLKTLNLWKP